MKTACRNLVVGLATLVAAGMLPAVAKAASLGYSNDTRVPLVIQVSLIINNQERKSQPRSINPRERNFEPIVAPGVKQVNLIIFDAQLRQLARFPINFMGRDVFYSIQVDQVGALRLIEIRMPAPGPGGQAFPGAMPGFPGAMPGFPPGVMPGFPGALPGFPGTMPATPGVPLPGTVPATGGTPTPAPPPTNTTAPIPPKTTPVPPKKN